MKSKTPSKFIGFFKLIEAMRKDGCPVCRRTMDESHHAMESFLYESVNDPGLRDVIRRNGGLCHRHSWALVRFGDALGGAILFRDILEHVMAKLNDGIGAGGAFFSRRPIPVGPGPRSCFFCRSERQSHDAVIGTIAEHLADPELRAAWDGPARLCVPHLTEVMEASSDRSGRKELLELHCNKYRWLCAQMQEVIAKHSYDRSAEGWGKEKDSWLRAVESLVDRDGL